MYLTRNWLAIILPFCAISIFATAFIFLVPESQKFLKDQDRKKIQEVPKYSSRGQMFDRQTIDLTIADENEKPRFMNIFKDWTQVINLIIMICSWSFTSAGYYLVCYNVKYFEGSVYTNSILLGVAGLIGVILFSILINLISSKKLLISSFFLTLFGSVGYLATLQYPSLVPIWILFMVGSFSIQFSLCYYLNCELFQPAFRTRVYSICNFCSRSCSMLSPLLSETLSNPIILISACSILMLLLSLNLTPKPNYRSYS
ncbi:unnamed protein product [Moneuplotes crassus]|uniref:Uncharacterized protein n=1 Tax=Euplotes crassus TaxID=5936 RepID=A0AAD1XIG2_EUPCR|nr:unnamed protein product [Moneuplotes crassus]